MEMPRNSNDIEGNTNYHVLSELDIGKQISMRVGPEYNISSMYSFS